MIGLSIALTMLIFVILISIGCIVSYIDYLIEVETKSYIKMSLKDIKEIHKISSNKLFLTDEGLLLYNKEYYILLSFVDFIRFDILLTKYERK